MLVSVLFTSTVMLSAVPGALGYPGMERQLVEIASRQDSESDGEPSTELLGDLITLNDSDLTPTGRNIKDLLLANGEPQSTETYQFVPRLQSPQCAQDTCCVWKYIADEMAQLFRGTSGRCTKWARMAVRLGFHDAGAWSKTSGAGGADGSMVLSDEWQRSDNNGLGDFVSVVQGWQSKYLALGFPVSAADLIQTAATVAAVVCPLGPRVRTFVGRLDSPRGMQDPPGLLPSAFQSADELIALFRAKTFTPHDLVALVGAHTTSQQRFVDPARAGDPQDSTPGVWDVLFYRQTLGTAARPQRVFMFPSDVALSRHPDTRGEWRDFAGVDGQSHWNEDYARAYIRLSLLGVNNINNLTECSKVLPGGTPSFLNPDQGNLNKWLNSFGISPMAKMMSSTIENGDSVAGWFMGLLPGFLGILF